MRVLETKLQKCSYEEEQCTCRSLDTGSIFDLIDMYISMKIKDNIYLVRYDFSVYYGKNGHL